MTWNENLHRYWAHHGGTLFAIRDKTWDGTLVLDDSRGPLLIRTEPVGPNRYELDYYVTVTTQVTMERPYALHVYPASLMWGGVNQVLGGLKNLGLSTSLYQDYHAPKALGRRRITTSEPPFTKWVLQSAPLLELLSQRKEWAVHVGPSGAEERLHAVTAYGKAESFNLAPDPIWGDNSPEEDPEAAAQRTPTPGFDETLSQLIQLAEEARAAVTAWPMPVVSPQQ